MVDLHKFHCITNTCLPFNESKTILLQVERFKSRISVTLVFWSGFRFLDQYLIFSFRCKWGADLATCLLSHDMTETLLKQLKTLCQFCLPYNSERASHKRWRSSWIMRNQNEAKGFCEQHQTFLSDPFLINFHAQIHFKSWQFYLKELLILPFVINTKNNAGMSVYQVQRRFFDILNEPRAFFPLFTYM